MMDTKEKIAGNKKRLTIKKPVLIILTLLLIIAVFVQLTPDALGDKYGVFLSEIKNLSRLGDYETVVIDAQYFSKEEIDAFKSEGHKVYSYINIGSIEEFRPYYDE